MHECAHAHECVCVHVWVCMLVCVSIYLNFEAAESDTGQN